jgi:iron complex outermembrane recepter protein
MMNRKVSLTTTPTHLRRLRPGVATSRLPLVSAIMMASTLSSPLALGQQESFALEEVLVTARKRIESIQDVPVSVTAISEQLRDATIQRLDDLSAMAPNVVIESTAGTPGGARLSIRGVSYQEIDKSFDPAIGVIMDGMYLGTSSGSMLQNFDTARIEVLRGPQGTLFGKNTIGGVINVIRGDVTMDWGLDASITMGEDGREDYKAVVNVPVIDDKLGLKLFANSINSDGYVRNTTLNEDVGGDDFETYGFAALARPTEDLSLKLHYERNNNETDTGFAANHNQMDDLVCIIGLVTPLWTAGQSCGAFDNGSDDTHTSADSRNRNDSEIDSVIGTVEWDLDSFTLTSITAYREMDEHNYRDFDASAANFLALDYFNEYEQFSQELRVTSQFSDTVEFVGGLYYWDSEYEQFWNTLDLIYALDQAGFLAPGVLPPGGAGIPSDHQSTAGQFQDTKSYAAFFSGDWHITDKLTLNAGLRYTVEEKDFSGSGSVDNQIGDPRPELTYTSFDEDWSELSPKLGFSYDYSDDVMLFGSWAEGFKSGGYFGRNTDFSRTESYDPETVDTFELGMKSEWLDRRLIFNSSIFYSEYQDKQEEVLVFVSNTSVATNVSNASTVVIQGIDLELQFQITEALSVRAAYGYLDAEYDKYFADLNDDGIVTDNSDRILRNTPENTLGVSTSYRVAVGSGEFHGYLAYRYRDEIESIANNDPLGHLDSIERLDVSLNYAWDDNRYRVTVFGRNLTDEVEGRVTRINGLTTWQQWSEPTTWGAEFAVSF